MAASVNDKFRKASSGTRPVPTYLTSAINVGTTSATINSGSGWNTTTGVDLIIYQIDTAGEKIAGTQTDWKATLSGTSLNDLTLMAGTIPSGGYLASTQSVVIASPTAAWSDSLVDGILTSLDQDGTLKAGAVDNAAALASDVVTTAKILDANVTNAKLATGTGQPGGAWQSWTPTYANMSVGNGTVNTCKYTKVGRTIKFRYKLTLGSTSTIGASPSLTVPETAASEESGLEVGHVSNIPSASPSVRQVGPAFLSSTTVLRLMYLNVNAVAQDITATTPNTWTTGDTLEVRGEYEAAS